MSPYCKIAFKRAEIYTHRLHSTRVFLICRWELAISRQGTIEILEWKRSMEVQIFILSKRGHEQSFDSVWSANNSGAVFQSSFNNTFTVGRLVLPRLPEGHQHLRALQQGLDQGEDLHLAEATSGPMKILAAEKLRQKLVRWRKKCLFFRVHLICVQNGSLCFVCNVKLGNLMGSLLSRYANIFSLGREMEVSISFCFRLIVDCVISKPLKLLAWTLKIKANKNCLFPCWQALLRWFSWMFVG